MLFTSMLSWLKEPSYTSIYANPFTHPILQWSNSISTGVGQYKSLSFSTRKYLQKEPNIGKWSTIFEEVFRKKAMVCLPCVNKVCRKTYTESFHKKSGQHTESGHEVKVSVESRLTYRQNDEEMCTVLWPIW